MCGDARPGTDCSLTEGLALAVHEYSKAHFDRPDLWLGHYVGRRPETVPSCKRHH